jgi:hypothetical protein
MALDSRVLAAYVGIFATLGTVFGLVGFLSVRWAETVYIASASGGAAGRLGPIFAGLVTFQNSVLLQFLAPLLTFVFGFVFGSREFSVGGGALLGATGGAVGYVALMLPALALSVLAPSGSQVFPLPSILPLVAAALVLSGVAGAVGGYLGARTS